MKKRALFVDDEPLVLSGLRRMLRSLRHDWDMVFANSGQEALERLEEETFAVVVSDMRMPEMDGATLLNEVARRHPAVARLVLSGHAELDAILRAVRPAHQFLAKPCDPKLLEQALQRILQVGADDRQNSICTRLGAHRRLPSPSSTIEALRTELLATPADLEAVSAIISSDVAMSIQALRLVNSAFFGPPTRTLDPRRAVSILGADILIALIDDVGLFRPVEPSIHEGEAAVSLVNQRAVEVARTVRADSLDRGEGIGPDIWAMMSLAGSLAAIEIPDSLDAEGEQALSKLLLAYWGLDVEIDSYHGSAAKDVSSLHADLLGVG